MTRDKAEYIRNWLFRANEDISVSNRLVYVIAPPHHENLLNREDSSVVESTSGPVFVKDSRVPKDNRNNW